MTTLETCLRQMFKEEGGYSNNPRDNGGMTNLGVTHKTWADWTGKPATEAVMRGLTIPKVTPLYRERYWQPVRGDDLPPALAMCVFDFAVNAGPGRATRWLQKLVNASPDGKMGPATLRAVQAYVTAHGLAETVRQFMQMRRNYYRQLDDFDVFGRGWLRRVDTVETAALRLIR